MSSPWVEPGTSCTMGSAILDVGVGLVLGVFRVASRYQVPKGTLRTSNTGGRVKETSKKRKKICPRQGSNPGPE